MKVILSRKGFDSVNGGYPSPILPDGRMVSLPIPVCSSICYSDLQLDNKTYYDVMHSLRTKIHYDGKWHKLTQDTECHLDPDIFGNVIKRSADWKGCFGQVNSAQSHLENQCVKIGDLFLFFGWFRHTKNAGNSLRFDGKDIHAIFGYMQIGEVINVCPDYQEPEWMKGHPHLEKNFNHSNNVIYAARDHLSWDQNLPGAGVFNFNEKLVLTKHGLSRSKWCLPALFRKAKISYHDESSWKDGYFQSAMIGQEFVIQDNECVENWAKEIIYTGLKNL
jgi:hypothetical protein